MSEVKTEFLETSADLKVRAFHRSRLPTYRSRSVTFTWRIWPAGVEAVRRTFAAAAPWAHTARIPQAVGCDKKSVRVSTCFLIDDYFSRFSSPAEVIPMVLAAAEREGVEIDYLARESACASANGVSPASLTLGSLVTEPVQGTTGGSSAAHRDRLADQRSAVAWRLPGRGDDQANPVASAPGERASATLHLRRRRALG